MALPALEAPAGAAPRRGPVLAGTRPRILLCTEGTYPYVMGGVSSWCDLLVTGLDEFDWQVLPIVAPGRRTPLYALPPQAREVGRVEVWTERLPRGSRRRRSGNGVASELPETLVRHLIGWEGEPAAVLDAYLGCRRHPADVRRVFRSARGWAAFQRGLAAVLAERIPEAGTPPVLDLVEAAALYQTLYWVARTAAEPTPATDLLHVTAAGWSAIPALVHKALHGTPMVLTEHGVYLREAYLAAARSGDSPGARFTATRLARGLTRSAYAGADVVCPVTDANAYWEMGLGLERSRILVLYNGLRRPTEPTAPPESRTVVSVGRIDPLKDIHTLLRVAAGTVRMLPDSRFRHYGSVSPGQEAYGRSCLALHERLGLSDRFRFMGRTTDPNGAVRDADVVLMTSISEGLPMSILEAMSEGRPVVSTGVGGVPDVVTGCGVVTPPGDDHALAMAVTTLLRNPALARRLGLRGHARLGRIFNEEACVEGYRDLLRGLTGSPARGGRMSPRDGETVRALRLVEARLGRAPQDMLEAAVVLEAWGGAPAQEALDTGRALMAVPAPALVSVSKPQAPPAREGVLIEAVAFVVTVLAIALWAAPLADGLGGGVVAQALKVALPLTLALQWGLRSRYLGRPGGLLELARQRHALLGGACAIVVAPTLLLGAGGTTAGLLTLTWIGGTVLIRRRWYAVYAAIVIVATPAMLGGTPPAIVLAVTAAVTAAVVALALRPGAPGEPAAPGRATRAAAAAAIGGAVGLMLVADPSVTWTAGTIPALALLPSTIAGLWAGHRLWGLEPSFPRAVAGVAVGAPLPRAGRRGPLVTLLGSIARLLALTGALSAVLLLTPWLGTDASRAGLLAGFGLLALATLLAGLLEAMGSAVAAGCGLLAGVAVELAAGALGLTPFPGAPITAGAAVAVLVLLPSALVRVARPARTLATVLWIT